MNHLFLEALPSRGFPSLDCLSWQADVVSAHRQAFDLLTGARDLRRVVKEWLQGLTPEEADYIISHSVERPSHYKWYLGGSRPHYTVWLHQYRQPQVYASAQGFAASIHDHRLSFSSRVISGTLNVTWYRAEISGMFASLSIIRRGCLPVGAAVHMKSDEIHRIDSVDHNTCTLVIQGPAERHFSRVFDSASGAMRIYDDLDEVYEQLMRTLGASNSRDAEPQPKAMQELRDPASSYTTPRWVLGGRGG
jgi:hypothetical protein